MIDRLESRAGGETTAVFIMENRLLLEALQLHRGLLGGVQLVGRATDVEESRDLILRTSPSVLLVDGPNFQRGFRDFGEELPFRLGQIRLAVLADGLSDAQFELALSVGVVGFLSQQDSLADLAADLQAVAGGEQRISSRFSDRITPGDRGGQLRVDRRHCLQRFSDRQLEVLMQLAEGRRVKDIAAAMQLTEKAIESHKYRLMNRLGIHDRVALCRWAIREGLISP